MLVVNRDIFVDFHFAFLPIGIWNRFCRRRANFRNLRYLASLFQRFLGFVIAPFLPLNYTDDTRDA